MPEIEWRTGLVFGKFMPVHAGHLHLIRFAASRCRRLVVLVCTQSWEPIDDSLRWHWVQELLADEPTIDVQHCTKELPYTGMPSFEISRIWASYLRDLLPEVDVLFTSEDYGDEVAHIMEIPHLSCDRPRHYVPVSARAIRSEPWRHWQHIPAVVRPHFVQKVCLFGPESVGKSTLALQLAEHFNTVHVPEVARSLIADSNTCTFQDLQHVAEAQARAIEQALPAADRVLFSDTDLLTTRVYARFLFDRDLEVAPWVEQANRFQLHLLCESDLPYVQDGSRLGAAAQPALRDAFRAAIPEAGLPYEIVHGTDAERIERAIDIVNRNVLPIPASDGSNAETDTIERRPPCSEQ